MVNMKAKKITAAVENKKQFEAVLKKWKSMGLLDDYSSEVVTFFTRMSYNVVKNMKEENLRNSYASELKQLFYSYFDMSKLKTTPTDIPEKLAYISNCAALIAS